MHPRSLLILAACLAGHAFAAAGIAIYALTPQNEPNILNVYPTCLWTGSQLREFIADYLGPTLRDRKTSVELWLGLNGDPFNDGENANARLVTVLEDPKASAFLTGIAFQYDSRNQTAVAAVLYPDKKLMQSETECNKGDNSWADAQRLYGLMKRYLENGAGSYFAWNMVLDETGMSTWKWRQNALITVDHVTGKVTYNGEYYAMRHFSQYVKPGAKRVLTTGGWGDKIAFVNPYGSTVIVIANSAAKPYEIVITVAGRSDGGTFKATLPAGSIDTFIVPPPNSATAALPASGAPVANGSAPGGLPQ
jgi:glucosylceramidase